MVAVISGSRGVGSACSRSAAIRLGTLGVIVNSAEKLFTERARGCNRRR
jgi:hypothetical protein